VTGATGTSHVGESTAKAGSKADRRKWGEEGDGAGADRESKRGGCRGCVRTTSSPDSAGTESTTDEAAKAARGGEPPDE